MTPFPHLSSLATLAALTLATVVPAQDPPRSPGQDTPHLAPSLLVVSPAPGPRLQFPGVFGFLEVDLQRAVVVTIDENASSAHALLDSLGPQWRGRLWFQLVRRDEAGFHLSTARSIGEDDELRQYETVDEPTCRMIAENCIADAIGTEMAEGWPNGAMITGVRPLFRPDVGGVAYWEYAVQPSGFVIVSTGTHDLPIPNWSSVGEPRSRRLMRMAAQNGRTVARVFKLDTLCYVAEDSASAIVATHGTMPDQLAGLPARLTEQLAERMEDRMLRRGFPSWRALKVGFAEGFRPLLRQRHEEARIRWDGEGFTLSGSWGPWTTYTADGGTSEQPLYDQFDNGSCAVGCGPVAWAMLFGWGDYQAHDGNATWSARTGLYRTDGGTTASGASSSAVAPLSGNTWGIENVMRELNTLMGTWCIGSSGATWPSRMDDAQGYLDLRTGATCTSRGSDVGVNKDSYREDARNSIRDRGTPAVIGTGLLSHYPLAYKYRWRSKTDWLGFTWYDREFYVNQGWGSSSYFEWVDAGTFLVGQLFP